MNGKIKTKKTPFHGSGWLESIMKVYNLEKISIKEKNSEIIFLLIKKLGRKLVSIPYCDYGGFDINVKNFYFGYLDKKAEELGVDYVEIRSPSDALKPKLVENGFKNLKSYDQFSINLTVTDKKFWDNLNKKVRNSIRKAQKEGIIVREGNDLESFYKLYRKSRKLLGTPHHPLSFFEEIYKKCDSKLMFSELDGKKIAVSWFLIHDRKLYYWMNASNKKYIQMNPNDLIMFEIAEWGIKNKFKSIELGRSSPETGTYFFKKKWATSKKEMDYYYKLYKITEIPDKDSIKYIIIRKMWNMIPSFITNFIGPRIRKYFP